MREKEKKRKTKIIGGSFDTKLELEHAGVAAGFPSPAELSNPYDKSAYCNNQTITSAIVCC